MIFIDYNNKMFFDIINFNVMLNKFGIYIQ